MMPKKRATVSNPKVPRTRNAGTMTEAAYWGKVRGALRQVFSRWKPGQKVFDRIKVRVVIPDRPRKRFQWRCEQCHELFDREQIRIDHVTPCGPLRCDDDVIRFLHILTSEDESDFQGVCCECHQAKTNEENAARREARKANQ